VIGPILKEIDHAVAVLEPSSMASVRMTPPEQTSAPLEAEAEERLRRELERLRASSVDHERGLLELVLEQSPHGVLICDPQGALVLRSRAADRIWAGSATAEDVEGWGKYRAYHPDGSPYQPSAWAMARCLTLGEVVDAEEVHFQRFDGTHGMLLGSCAPLLAPDGRLLGAVSVFADITRFKQVERLKDQWVAVAGHEMRTPLSVMRLRISQAQRNLQRLQPQDITRLLSLLDDQVERLNTMVNDMLDVSRAQAGTLHVELEVLPLRQLIARVVEVLQHGTTAHELRMDIPECRVRCDRVRTEQVLANLINNAIRYSNSGYIDVRVKTSNLEALIEVQDQGRGLAEDQIPHLFEPFTRVEHDATREGGLGLGLYLARELVTRMGGRIWAASPGPDLGATFTFSLPFVLE